MAFIRQNGGPSLFATFSAAEFAWDHLALREGFNKLSTVSVN